jgi:hypothetical protein
MKKVLGYFQAKPPIWIPQLFSNLVIIYLLAYEDGTECSETSAYTIQTLGNYPEGNIQQVVGHFSHLANTPKKLDGFMHSAFSVTSLPLEPRATN